MSHHSNQIKLKFWNNKLKEYILENKLATIFIEEDIANVLLEMEISNVQLFSSSIEYCINIKLKKPYEMIMISNHYSSQSYECIIRNNKNEILSIEDKKTVTKMFSGFDWFEMYTSLKL